MAKSKNAVPSSASKVFVLVLIGAGLALFIGLAASAFGPIERRGDIRNKLVNSDSYQAVHLVDGSVYFGSASFSGNNIVIDDTYYVDNADAATSEANLIKHGSEGYDPDGRIIVNQEQVLFWENLEDKSIVTRTIDKHSGGE